jgi:hypothetical protein
MAQADMLLRVLFLMAMSIACHQKPANSFNSQAEPQSPLASAKRSEAIVARPGEDGMIRIIGWTNEGVDLLFSPVVDLSARRYTYSVYQRIAADSTSFDHLAIVETANRVADERSETYASVSGLQDETFYDFNVVAKAQDGSKVLYRSLRALKPPRVRSFDFQRQIVIGQDLAFSARDFSDNFVSMQERPLAAIRMSRIPVNSRLSVGNKMLAKGDIVIGDDIGRVRLQFKAGSWWGDETFEWQANDGTSWSRVPGTVTIQRLLSSTNGYSQGKPLRGNPLGTDLKIEYLPWISSYPRQLFALQGATFDGHYVWFMPRTGGQILKIDIRSNEVQGLGDYPLGFLPGHDAFSAGIFDGESIWAIPLFGNAFVKIDKDSNAFSSIQAPDDSSLYPFHCAALNKGKIWTSSCRRVEPLSLDLSTKDFVFASGTGSDTAQCGECAYDGQNLWTLGLNFFQKTDLSTGMTTGVFPGMSSNLVGGLLIDGENLWTFESRGNVLKKYNLRSHAVTEIPDWGLDQSYLYVGSCGNYDGQSYYVGTVKKLVQVNVNTGRKSSEIATQGPSNGWRGCVFDGESLWLSPMDSISPNSIAKVTSNRPSTRPIEIFSAPNAIRHLDADIFRGAFRDPLRKPLQQIQIKQLPFNGGLLLNGAPVPKDVPIDAGLIGRLSYVPNSDFIGIDRILFRAGNDSQFSTVDETLRIVVGELRMSDGFSDSGLNRRGQSIEDKALFRHWSGWKPNPKANEDSYAGAVLDRNSIWLLPRSARQLLKIDRESGVSQSFINWPPGVGPSSDPDAFFGGVLAGRSLWLIPDTARQLVKVDTATGSMTGYDRWPSNFVKKPGSFAGGIFDGEKIWLIPSSSERLISMDPRTEKMNTEMTWPIGFASAEAKKFEGGVFDGQSIWLIPSHAKSLIQVDRETGHMNEMKDWPVGFDASAPNKFSGGAFDGKRIWLAPKSAQQLVSYDRDSGMMRAYSDWPKGLNLGKESFSGGVYDGKSIWLIPHDASHAVKIDPNTGQMTLGPAWPASFKKSSKAFSGGVFDGEFLWMVPFKAEGLLRLGTR